MNFYPIPTQLPEGCDVEAYFAQKSAELKVLQAGPMKTLEITLPLPIAEHLITTAGRYKKSVDDFVLTLMYSSYRTPEEKAEDKRKMDGINWQPVGNPQQKDSDS